MRDSHDNARYLKADFGKNGEWMRAITEAEVFLDVVRHGSFAAAARSLGMAASAVAERVAGLERRLGVRLLNRTTRRRSLTQAGHMYHDQAGRIVAELRALEQRIMDDAIAPRGLLRVTAPIPLGRRWIAPFVGNFLARYPDIQVQLVLGDAFVDIVGQGFDIAIRGGPALDSSLIGHALFETRRVVVASPDYLARYGAPGHPHDLAGHRCVVFNDGQSQRTEWRFGRGEQAISLRVEGVAATSSSDLPLEWALSGVGVVQKSWWEVAEHLAAGRLCTVLEAFEPDPARFFAIHPVSRTQSRKVGLFIEELRHWMAKGPF